MRKTFASLPIAVVGLMVLFNLIAVWGPQVLIHDDATNFLSVKRHLYPVALSEHGLILASASEWIAMNIMVQSKELVRLLYILLLMVPLSLSLYSLFREKFGLPREAALAGAVVPMVLPAQSLIPAFTNGSYPLLGLLVLTLCLHRLTDFARVPGRETRHAVAATLLYLAATQLMDQALFFFPLLLFILFFPGANPRGRWSLLAALSAVFIFKAAWFLSLPRTSAIPVRLEAATIAYRFIAAIDSMVPLPADARSGWLPVALMGALILAGFMIGSGEGTRSGHPAPADASTLSRRPFSFAYGALAVWFLGNILPLVTMAPGVNVRYFFIPAFGFLAALFLSLQRIAETILPRAKRLPLIAFLVIIVVSGLARQIELSATYNIMNEKQALIRNQLEKQRLPFESQVAVYITNANIYWGDWIQSSGHLAFMLNRDDVNGCIGGMRRYASQYDPFNPEERKFRSFFRGFSLDRPLFLFVQRGNLLHQYEYALRWSSRGGIDAWSILHVDKTSGRISVLHSGTGLSQLQEAVQRMEQDGIDTTEILWYSPLRGQSPGEGVQRPGSRLGKWQQKPAR